MNRPMTVVRRRAVRVPLRGVAALTVVMVLFFVMALVAAYTNRNMLFEQRISANNYRAARALDAADAAIEWTVALLNGGRVDANCSPSTAAGDADFRSRYLSESADTAFGEGAWGVVTGGGGVYPACVQRDGALNCICPSVGAAVPTMTLPADGVATAFRVQFLLPGQASRGSTASGGVIELATRGCASPGSGNTACYSQTRDAPVVDGLAGTLTTLGLVRALPLPPMAALTAGRDIIATAGQLLVSNVDPSTGLAAHAGRNINAPTSQFYGPAGSGTGSMQPADAALAALAIEPVAPATCPGSTATGDCWFRALFGMDRATFQRQPAVVRVPCPAGCTLTDLNDTLAGYPRNPIWVNGNLTLDAAANLGNAASVPPAPLMLIVDGNLTLSAGVQIYGFVHANNITWSSGTATMAGAMVAGNDFTATTTATLSYSRAAMDTLRLRYGSFVRTPGGWNLDIR